MNKLEFSKLNKKEDMILAFNQLKDDYRQLFAINDDLQFKIDKAIEMIEFDKKDKMWDLGEGNTMILQEKRVNELLDILKEDK